MKVLLRDLDILFLDEIFRMIISLKRRELAKKMRHTSFIDFDICHRMAPLRKIYLVTLA